MTPLSCTMFKNHPEIISSLLNRAVKMGIIGKYVCGLTALVKWLKNILGGFLNIAHDNGVITFR